MYHLVLSLLDRFIVKFEDLFAVGANDVVVVVIISQFEMGLAFGIVITAEPRESAWSDLEAAGLLAWSSPA